MADDQPDPDYLPTVERTPKGRIAVPDEFTDEAYTYRTTGFVFDVPRTAHRDELPYAPKARGGADLPRDDVVEFDPADPDTDPTRFRVEGVDVDENTD